jgi:hypothetical protein
VHRLILLWEGLNTLMEGERAVLFLRPHDTVSLPCIP